MTTITSTLGPSRTSTDTTTSTEATTRLPTPLTLRTLTPRLPSSPMASSLAVTSLLLVSTPRTPVRCWPLISSLLSKDKSNQADFPIAWLSTDNIESKPAPPQEVERISTPGPHGLVWIPEEHKYVHRRELDRSSRHHSEHSRHSSASGSRIAAAQPHQTVGHDTSRVGASTIGGGGGIGAGNTGAGTGRDVAAHDKNLHTGSAGGEFSSGVFDLFSRECCS